MRVQIYQDYVHNHGAIFRALCDHFGAGQVAFSDAADIIGGCLAQAELLVMPGGADLYYCEKLNGRGNNAIRAFVEAGGTYLGICAGAYYACARIDWASREGPRAILGNRELRFYGGVAQGPVYDFIEDGDFGKSWNGAAPLDYADDGHAFSTVVSYTGGPVFLDGDARVLGRYASLPGAPAAIVECKIGLGRAILCSPHIEVSDAAADAMLYAHNNPSHAWQTAVIDRLAPHAASRAILRDIVFDRALPRRARAAA